MLNAIPVSLARLCCFFAVLGLCGQSVLLRGSVRRTDSRRVLRLLLPLSLIAFFMIWALLTALAAVSLTPDPVSRLTVRWSLAAVTVLSVLSALLEHEWSEAIPGVCAFFTLPFFETAFGGIFPYVLLLMLLAAALYCALCLFRTLHDRQRLSVRSVQEAVDALSDGVLFADRDGRILLASGIMEALSISLCKKPLRSAGEFWKGLSEFTQTELVTKVTVGDSFLFRFAGGNTWTFHRETLASGAVTQMIALNVTESDAVQRQLLAKRAEYARLADEISGLDALTGRIHDAEDAARRGSTDLASVSKAMTALSRFLSEHYALPAESFDYQRLADSAVGMLGLFDQAPELTAERRIALTVRALELFGISASLSGSAPEEPACAETVSELLCEAGSCAVRHGASRVSAELRSEADAFLCSLTCDASLPPEGSEGAWARALALLSPLGGTLTVSADPEHTVLFRIPLSGNTPESETTAQEE